MKNIWKDGIMGVVIGDALGCPVQFESREEVAAHPVTGMRGFGTFRLPPGSWTDDSSLTLALLSSLAEVGRPDLHHIMKNFEQWLDHGAFTPYGYAYDIGGGTMKAIRTYTRYGDPLSCGGAEVTNNGNGSLMRILPICLFCAAKGMAVSEALEEVSRVGRLTHAHIRADIGCGLYFFMVRSLISGKEGSLTALLQSGLDQGFALYEEKGTEEAELAFYSRLRDLNALSLLPGEEISSSGYVVHTLEAAVWSLITTTSFEEALLRAVNLGYDTDTVGAVCGGLAGLYYGYDAIPSPWLGEIKRREWIEELCGSAAALS